MQQAGAGCASSSRQQQRGVRGTLQTLALATLSLPLPYGAKGFRHRLVDRGETTLACIYALSKQLGRCRTDSVDGAEPGRWEIHSHDLSPADEQRLTWLARQLRASGGATT
jgi:hypothetical protein